MVSGQPEPVGTIAPDRANGTGSIPPPLPGAASNSYQSAKEDNDQAARNTPPGSTSYTSTPFSAPTAALPSPVVQRTLSSPVSTGQDSAVMNETLHVIDEHITHLNTPRSSVQKDTATIDDSASEYSSYKDDNRLSYINGEETDEEEQARMSRSEVLRWNPAQVADYLLEIGVDKRHCDVFKEQEISGEVLLELDQESIFLKDFDLGPVGRRLRTWHKIKSLQQDLRKANTSGSMAGFGSTDIQGKLPKIPSVNESQPVQITARQLSTRVTSQPQLFAPEHMSTSLSNNTHSPNEVTKSSPTTSRSFGHSKRHSSVDVRRSISSQISHESNNPSIGRLNNGQHRKQASFDRGWTMTPAQAGAVGSGPPSAAFSLSGDSDKLPLPTQPAEPKSTGHSLHELDRGYFSGGEVDNRKSRKVLQKKDDLSHSRNSSVSREVRRRSLLPLTTKQHARVGSVDSTRDVAPRRIAPAAKAYFSDSRKNRRATSGPEFTKPTHRSGEVTPSTLPLAKFDHGDPFSIDSVAASPKIAESESSSLGQSTPSATQSPSIASRLRSLGLKSLTDAVSGSEKAAAAAAATTTTATPATTAFSDVTASPNKDSPAQSPLTGSNTLSATSKATTIDEREMSKLATKSGSPSLQKPPTAGHRKSRKYIGTNVQGLEKVSPKDRMKDCDFSGWMKKKSSNLMTTWKPRLFVLKGPRLSYYYSEDDTEEKGLIDISSHRVLPANNERITGLHASITGVSSPTSPTSVRNTSGSPTSPSTPEETSTKVGPSGVFIFKLIPPRVGLSRAVNFTKPMVHYFAVETIELGRLWMAALMKVTISRDEATPVVTTYQQKTITLAQARATKQRPPALMNLEEESSASSINDDNTSWGLAIHGFDRDKETLPTQEVDNIRKSFVTYPESPTESRTEPLSSGAKHQESMPGQPHGYKTYSSSSNGKHVSNSNPNENSVDSLAKNSPSDTNSARASSSTRRRDTTSTGAAVSPPASATDSIGSSWILSTEGTSNINAAKNNSNVADTYSYVRHRTLSAESDWSAKYNIR